MSQGYVIQYLGDRKQNKTKKNPDDKQTSGNHQVCLLKQSVSQDATLWSVVRSEPRDLTAYLQKHISEPRGSTGGFPAHQRCTSNRGLWAARASRRENTSRSAPLKEGALNFL